MAKKRNAPKTLADATSNEIAALASALVRRPTPAVLNITPQTPCDFVTAVVMKFACSREEAGTIPLDDLRAELSTAVGREHWSAELKQYGYRIDVPAEAPLQSGPSARQMARVRNAVRAAGKGATPARVLATMKSDNTERKGMRRTVFLECLKHLAAGRLYSGHKLAR